MKRSDIRQSILEMINVHPYDNVDISPLIEQLTEERTYQEQGQIRMTIRNVLQELKDDGYITFSSQDLDINSSQYGEYLNSHAFIRSTSKYEKEKITTQPTPSVSVGGNYVGNMNFGRVNGGLTQTNSGYLDISDTQEEELRRYGVEDKEIVELKSIIKSSPDKTTFLSKSLKWLSAVSSSMAARGLYDNFPAIVSFIENLHL